MIAPLVDARDPYAASLLVGDIAVVLSTVAVVELDTVGVLAVSAGSVGLVVGSLVSVVVAVSAVAVWVWVGASVVVGAAVALNVGVSVDDDVASGVLVVFSAGSVTGVVTVALGTVFLGVAVSFSVVGTDVSLVVSVVLGDSTRAPETLDGLESDAGLGADADILVSPAQVKVTETKASKNEPPRSSRA